MGKKKKPAQVGRTQAAAKQRRIRFAEAYLSYGENATAAAKAVGFSAKSAHAQGCRLLKNAEVQQIVEKRRIELRARFSLTTERVMLELGRVAYFDPGQLVDPITGRPKALHEIDENTRVALASYELVDGVLKARGHNKVSTLGQVSKILRLYDKPPPPPDESGRHVAQDPREVARKMAFLLARGDAAAKAKV